MNYLITDYGAFDSTEVLQTKAIQDAIDQCFLAGGGVVVIPSGTYLTGCIRLRSNVTLYLKSGAVLLGSRNPEDYFSYLEDEIEPLGELDVTELPRMSSREYKRMLREQGREGEYYEKYYQKAGRRWNNALIRAIRAQNIAIIGEEGSVIDGANCYDGVGEEGYRGPHAITMHDCKNILFKGYTMKNSSNWGHNIVRSSNITCEKLTILGGHDGVHFTQCNNVDVVDSEFHTGDDCIAGFANINVTVSNCKVNSSCSAFRFAGTNVLIQNCHIWGPGQYAHRYALSEEEKMSGQSSENASSAAHRKNMVSAITYYADYSFPIKERPCNIIIKDCVIENTDRFLHYNYSGNEIWQQQRPLGDIMFQNIKASGIKMPINAYGDKEDPVTITMKNIEISDSQEFKAEALIHACHYEKIILEDIRLSNVPCKVLVKRWSTDGEIIIKNIISELDEEAYVKEADTPFFSKRV